MEFGKYSNVTKGEIDTDLTYGLRCLHAANIIHYDIKP